MYHQKSSLPSRTVILSCLLLSLVWLAPASSLEPLQAPPVGEQIRVAFVLAQGATMIDFTGPWEVFQDVHISDRGTSHAEVMPFKLYTVAASREPVQVTGGMRILPDYSFQDAPQPHVIVVPALRGSAEMHEWLRSAGKEAHLTMSVCTGAFQLAKAGILDGLRATTHHGYLNSFESKYGAKVELMRDVRWVDNGKVATAAGLTSGIDLALHVVERYFGTKVAKWTADYMEHDSDDWRDGGGTLMASAPIGRGMPLALEGFDPVALIEGDKVAGSESLSYEFEGFEYRFASRDHLDAFTGDPARYGIQLEGACAAMGPGSGGGDPSIFLVHDRKIYIFGSATCREHFTEDPDTHLAKAAG